MNIELSEAQLQLVANALNTTHSHLTRIQSQLNGMERDFIQIQASLYGDLLADLWEQEQKQSKAV